MSAQPANFRPEHRLRWPLLEGLLPFDKARLGPDIMAGNDDRPTRGTKACRTLRWRTMVAFHKISVFHPIITRERGLGTKFLKLASLS